MRGTRRRRCSVPPDGGCVIRSFIAPQLILASALAVAAAGEAVAQESGGENVAGELAGCYRLAFRARTNNFPAGDLERRVWLTLVELADDDERVVTYAVRPAPGERASEFDAVYWRPHADGKGLSLTWTTGFHGVSMTLGVTGAYGAPLTGEAQTFSDVLGSESAIAGVTATPVECKR